MADNENELQVKFRIASVLQFSVCVYACVCVCVCVCVCACTHARM